MKLQGEGGERERVADRAEFTRCVNSGGGGKRLAGN